MSNLSVAIKVSADASQAEAGFGRGTAAVNQFSGSLSQSSAAAANQAAEVKRAAEQTAQAGQAQAAATQAQAQAQAGARQQLAEAERTFAASVVETNRALAAREIDGKQAQATLQRTRREMDSYREAVERQGKAANDNSYRNKQLTMQLSDTFQTLALGMPIQQVILQQGPQIIDLFGGMGVAAKALVSPVGLLVAGMTAVAVAGVVLVSRLESSERALNAAAVGLTATGRASELSRAQVQSLTDQFAKLPGATRSGAEQSVAALSRLRQVSVQLFGDIGKAASNFMVLTGTEFPEASAELSEYLKAPTEGAKKFADAWGGLSVAQLEAIESMDRSGNRLGAQRELLGAMQARLQDLAKVGKTELQQAGDSMGKSWDDMLTKLSRTAPIIAAREALISLFKGVAQAASEASLDDQIAELDKKLANPPVLGMRPDGTPIYDRGRADYVDARRRREQLDLRRQARDAAGYDEASAFSFGPRPAANDDLPDPTKIKDLIGAYDELATRRKTLMDQMTLLSRAAGQEGVDQDALSRALQNLMGQYDALKDPIDQARDALSAEQRVAASSIGTRQVLQAQIQAEQAALQAGQPKWKAEELGKLAAAQATVQLITAARDQVVLSADEAKGALTVASAYLQGARAANQATIAEEARQAAVKNAFVDERALTAALTARAAAQATIGGAKAVAELQQRVEATERLAEAEKAGAAAVTETGIANEVAAYALQLRATETDKTRDANDKLIESYERLLRRQDEANRSATSSQALRNKQEQLELAQAELRLVGALPPEHDRQIERLKTIQDLRRRGVDLSSEQAQAELRATDQLAKVEAQVQQARNAAAETNRIWDRAADGIQDALSDAFMSAFDRSKNGGFDAAAALLKIFKSVAAEIASAMVIKPIIGSVASFLGAPQSWLYDRGYTQAAAQGGAGGGNILSNLSSLSNLLPKNFTNSIASFLGLGSTGAISAGSSALAGIGSGALASGVNVAGGAIAAGSAALGAGLGGAAGGAVAGGAIGAGTSALAGGAITGAAVNVAGAGAASMGAMAAAAIPYIGLAIAAFAMIAGSGMFADKDYPRGYAASEIRNDGKFIASTQHQAGLDGYDNSRDRQEAKKFSTLMNSTVQSLGLSMAVSKDDINHNGASNGLLTIGTMYGGALDADDLFMRWFTKDQRGATGSADTSESTWMRAKGYTRTSTYDRDSGWTHELRDDKGVVVTQEMWTKAYEDWVKDQSSAAKGEGGKSLFKTDNKTFQVALDRMASGAYKPADADELKQALQYAEGFEDAAKRAAAGFGTLQRQALEFELAARDAAKALNQQVKDYLDQAEKIFGKGSTQAQQAKDTQLQAVLGQMGIGPNADDKPLEGLQATIAETIAGINAMTPVLITLGKTSEEAASIIAQATAKYRAKVAEDYNKSVSDQIQGFKAPEKLAWKQLGEAQEKQWKEAQAAGADMAKIAELQALQTQALFDQFQQQRQARLDSLSQRVYAVDATLNPANARANEDAVRKIQQRREAEDLTRGLEKAEADVLRQRLAEIHAAEDLAVKLARLEEDRQKAEGYMARTANAVAGVMTGSPGEQQAKALAEDVSRALSQAQELRQARDEAERSTLKQIQALENQAVAAERAAAAAQQFKQVSEQVSQAVAQSKTQIKAWLDQLRTGTGGGLDPLGRLNEAKLQFQTQFDKAKGGDLQALSGITGYAQRLLENAAAYYGTGTEYQNLRQMVESKLGGLPEQVDQLEAVRLEIAKLNTDSTTVSKEQQALLDQLTNLRTVALSAAVQDADRNATDAAAAIQALQGATNTALTASNQVAAQVVAQLAVSNATLTATQSIAGNTATAATNTATAASNTALSASNTAASTATMASMLTVLQSSFSRMGDLGQIMGGVGNLVAENTNHRQSVWNAEAAWLWKITYNTGGTVSALGGMPAYAGGTDWHAGGRAIVGERGAEIIDLPTGARVTPVGRYSPPRAPAGSVANDTGAGLVQTAAGVDLRPLLRALEQQGEQLREIAAAIDEQTDTMADGQGAIASRIAAGAEETGVLIETLKRTAGRRGR